jgi:hypothetical protein
MTSAQPLDRAKIEEAFRLVGQYLLDRKTLGEIAIYGGSAIILQFDWRKTSIDVDARVTSQGNHGVIMDAVREAAKRLGLPRSWLNENVTMYARRGERDADRVFVGLYPSPERFGLRVTAARPEYILAMKLRALERATADDRDYRDAIDLALECEVNTIDDFKKTLQRFFGSDELPAFAEGRLASLIAAVREKRQS